MDAYDGRTASGAASVKDAEALNQGAQAVFTRHTPDSSTAVEAPGQPVAGTGQAVPLDPVIAEANREAVRRFVVGFFAAADRRISKALYVQAKPIGEDFALEISREVAMEEAERENLGELSAIIAEKWGLNFKYATECAAGLIVGGWLTGIGIAFKKTAQLRKAKEEPKV